MLSHVMQFNLHNVQLNIECFAYYEEYASFNVTNASINQFERKARKLIYSDWSIKCFQVFGVASETHLR